jgi:hypothetical protein
MRLGTLETLAEAMKDIAPVIEKAGFNVIGIIDCSDSAWEHVDIRILPKPRAGSAEEKILKGEGF